MEVCEATFIERLDTRQATSIPIALTPSPQGAPSSKGSGVLTTAERTPLPSPGPGQSCTGSLPSCQYGGKGTSSLQVSDGDGVL